MIEIREYLKEDGKSPFAIWFHSLHAPAAAKASIALSRMENGNFSNVKGVGSGVLEYRIDFGPGYRQGRRNAGNSVWGRLEKEAAERH